ncbi:MAG: hypothetical protein RXN91_09355 [Caldivirga sp.]
MPRPVTIQCREEYLEDAGLRVIVCRSGDLVLSFPPWANKRLLKRYIIHTCLEFTTQYIHYD